MHHSYRSYERLPEETKGDWNQLKTAFLAQYEIDPVDRVARKVIAMQHAISLTQRQKNNVQDYLARADEIPLLHHVAQIYFVSESYFKYKYGHGDENITEGMLSELKPDNVRNTIRRALESASMKQAMEYSPRIEFLAWSFSSSLSW
ncbi:hypothetical protein GX51_03758 [Blastomyces parvus]|uniref:Uncharacterized protein n=1 Tax=Blastomyces parvus TaxID=2060905 RepID=A0A2B7X5A9_9EURO|nr:hypothetical protein GX51_03758 [Blastomyces parvus]